jgi:hypothetical protein
VNYRIIKYFNIILILIVFFSPKNIYSHDYYLGKLTIDHPYIVKPMPGMKAASGYLVIKNKGKESEYLINLESLFSKNIELHEMTMVGDVMKMKKLSNGLEIPSGKEILLKPGGFHIMFKNLNKELLTGSKEKVILHFKNTGKIIVNFEISDIKKHSH